jgi:hypothetical protein
MPVLDEDTLRPVFAEMPPGPGLALLLGAQEYAWLDDFDIVEMARSARRLAAWATSMEYGAVAELSARRKAQGERLGAWDSEVGEWVTDEIAAALTLSGNAAAREVVIAEQLTETLPDTYRALTDGHIDADKAKVIASGVCGLAPDLARKVEQRVLPNAAGQTCAQLRHAVRAAIRDADPDAYAERRKQAEESRRVELWPTDEGTCDMTGRNLPAGEAEAAFNRINAIAQAMKADGDSRTIDQLRADVLIDLVRSQQPGPSDGDPQVDETADSPEQPTAEGEDADNEQRATAIADVLRDEVASLTDNLDRDMRARGGQAALVREAARRIKATLAELSCRWCVTTTDATETIIRHGVPAYRVPAAMRRAVQNRDKTCLFPGCRRHAAQCDVDHTIPHDKGGPTCPCNLANLCRRHHRLKQHPEWQTIHVWPGVLLWIAPTGHWYTTAPPRSHNDHSSSLG